MDQKEAVSSELPAMTLLLVFERGKQLTIFVTDTICRREPRSQLPRGRQNPPDALPPHVQGRYSL